MTNQVYFKTLFKYQKPQQKFSHHFLAMSIQENNEKSVELQFRSYVSIWLFNNTV